VVHGAFPVRIPLPLKLSEVLHKVYEFLERHPTEAVIVSLKAEGASKWRDGEFFRIVWDYYITRHQDKWYLDNRVPRLGQARGKVILFRRFGLTNESRVDLYGIDAAFWCYNTPQDDIGLVVVQDFCEIPTRDDIMTKRGYVLDHLTRARNYNVTSEAGTTAKLFLNFCTGANFFDRKCWPRNVARRLESSGVYDELGSGAGIIVLDFAESNQWAVVRALVESNKFLTNK
jgi:1-phosphatidylinositol phosphodiesterase